jgi:hypothetical protein
MYTPYNDTSSQRCSRSIDIEPLTLFKSCKQAVKLTVVNHSAACRQTSPIPRLAPERYPSQA